MKKELIIRVVFCLFLPMFLLMCSYYCTIHLITLTPAQQETINFVESKNSLSLNYTASELSHLQDVQKVMEIMNVVFYLSLIICASLIVYSYKNKPELQKMLLYGGISTTIFLALILLATFLNFDSAFTLFHQLFFPQGNWQFAADSLLITTFPIEFFISISRSIFLLTLGEGMIFILLGVFLIKKREK